MTSKALQINDAIVVLLTASALTGIGSGGVNGDPDYPHQPGDLPALAVYLGDEPEPDRSLIGAHDHTVAIKLQIISEGHDAYRSADAVMVDAHNRLMSDLSLGGLTIDIRQGQITRQRAMIEFPVLMTEIEYQVDYRTTTTSLEN